MKRRRHTPEQIIRKLAEGEKLLGQGKTVEEVTRHLEITESTWHRWRNQYGGMKADDAKKLKELEHENTRLKKIVADQALDIEMLKELNRENGDPGRRRRAVATLREQFGVSERRACRVVGPAPIHPAPPSTGPVRRRAGSAGVPPGLLKAPSPLGLAACGHSGEEGRLGGEQQADPPPVAGRRPACALSEEEAPTPWHRGGRRGDVPDPAERRLGARLPVRPDH